jgi:hypothetical protein
MWLGQLMVFLAANAHRVHAGTFNSLIRSYSHAGTRSIQLFIYY